MLDKITVKHIVAVMIIAVLAGVVGIFLLVRNGTPQAEAPVAELAPDVVTEVEDVATEAVQPPPFDVRNFVAPSLGVNELVFANPYNLPETPHGGNILHAWNMSFNEIIEHLPYIARAGFGVIQTSPIGASLVRQENMGTFGRWYDLYQPTYFRIGNYLGTEEEFRALTRAAAEYGIFVIVDAIPNHTTAYWYEIDPALRAHDPSLFHSRHGENMLSNIWMAPMDFGDRRSFVRSNLLGLWDFYTSRPEFQEIYMTFLGDIIDAGASGFRYDAMHHIELPNDPPDIASDFWPIVSAFVDQRVRELGRIPFQYGEILGGGYRANHYLHALYEHAHVLITPYAFSRGILGALDMGFLRDGQDGWNSTNFHVYGNPRNHGDSFFGPAFTAADLGGFEGFAEGVVPWVESHDQYGNAGMSRHLTDEQILVGWALIAARQGTSPLFFVRPGDGFVNSGNMFVPQDDGAFTNRWGHNLFYRDPAVAAVNWFANDFINYGEVTSTHGNVAMVQRGEAGRKTGAVLANIGARPAHVLFPVELVDGAYTCRVSGHVYIVQSGWLTGPMIMGRSVLVLRDHSYEIPTDLRHVVELYMGNMVVGNEFYSPDGFTFSAISKHVESQYIVVYKNGDIILNTPVEHGQQLTLGEDAEIGDMFVISIVGIIGGEAVAMVSVDVTKAEKPEPTRIRVEYVRNVNPWPQAGIWAWNARGDVFSGGWPGPEMEWAPRLDGEGYAWVFYLPEDTAVPVTLIFNNFGAGEQTVPYLTIVESTRVFQIGDGVEIGNAEVIGR